MTEGWYVVELKETGEPKVISGPYKRVESAREGVGPGQIVCCHLGDAWFSKEELVLLASLMAQSTLPPP